MVRTNPSAHQVCAALMGRYSRSGDSKMVVSATDQVAAHVISIKEWHFKRDMARLIAKLDELERMLIYLMRTGTTSMQ